MRCACASQACDVLRWPTRRSRASQKAQELSATSPVASPSCRRATADCGARRATGQPRTARQGHVGPAPPLRSLLRPFLSCVHVRPNRRPRWRDGAAGAHPQHALQDRASRHASAQVDHLLARLVHVEGADHDHRRLDREVADRHRDLLRDVLCARQADGRKSRRRRCQARGRPRATVSACGSKARSRWNARTRLNCKPPVGGVRPPARPRAPLTRDDINVVLELRRDRNDRRAVRDRALDERADVLVLRLRRTLLDQVDFVLQADRHDMERAHGQRRGGVGATCVSVAHGRACVAQSSAAFRSIGANTPACQDVRRHDRKRYTRVLSTRVSLSVLLSHTPSRARRSARLAAAPPARSAPAG